ncbi:MAG TPA: glutamine--tRNA ligase/YqeY domain fusion protein [Chitinophagaceae bacterium]|nr:glutamine--tRNA ligase/YqeY domain fusion protein [Chitinophagaceae bacterium]
MSEEKALNFIEQIVGEDLARGLYGGRVLTRFPPEPNGHLHIGHAKSICLNFGIAAKYGGKTNLRFDDTNPETEETEYVQSIKEDIRWLGFEWSSEHYASDYFQQLYDFALDLIRKGLAYVEDCSSEQIALGKGTPTESGTESPFRSRSVEENLGMFTAMKEGKYLDGEKVLRAKIDMSSSNMHLRDPIMYRIRHADHHRTGNDWSIYPMYDFAHGQSDSIEQVTHSICTLEFVSHRPLYDWFIEKLGIFPSRQYEFARLNLTYSIMSKRKLLQLVQQGIVEGWDDPRMPTLSGLRRRGYTPASIREFCERIGVQKRDTLIDASLLEFCIREDLNRTARRVMAVLDPVKLVITNYPDDQVELLPAENNPEDPAAGKREVPFSRELWIEREDFMEQPGKKFFRLGPGLSVRLKNAYIIRCEDYKKDGEGRLQEIHCTYIPESRSGSDTSGMQPKGTLHWVSIPQAIPAEVRLYDRLFRVEEPGAGDEDFSRLINPASLVLVPRAWLEPSLSDSKPGDTVQFIRKGYFCADKTSAPDRLVFNRTVTLRDGWAKVASR